MTHRVATSGIDVVVKRWHQAAVVASLLVVLSSGCLFGRTPRIAGGDSIAKLERIEIGGVPQSVLLRGHDTANPVILFLHGGPGMPAMYLAHAFQRELERDFVVVHWDRRGAGKSFGAGRDRTKLTVSRTLADTVELTRLLRSRFDQDRIYLVGHSWGSYLGLLAAREYPEYYRAFIGMGQMAGSHEAVRSARLEFIRRAAHETGDEETIDRVSAGDYEVTEADLFEYGGGIARCDKLLADSQSRPFRA